ncbi:australin [Anaeramoeba flamelloides]|uniref:Australin n=1 Tax=Anaeramoeba flamelloides TaxID=1746091 RepID=A0ABQ8XGH5_9EUKA|nr:australin [Anaeramoeba flamelloides]
MNKTNYLLNEFDLEVKARVRILKVQKENLIQNIENTLSIELMKLPQAVKKLTVGEFLDEHQGNVHSALLGKRFSKTQTQNNNQQNQFPSSIFQQSQKTNPFFTKQSTPNQYRSKNFSQNNSFTPRDFVLNRTQKNFKINQNSSTKKNFKTRKTRNNENVKTSSDLSKNFHNRLYKTNSDSKYQKNLNIKTFTPLSSHNRKIIN